MYKESNTEIFKGCFYLDPKKYSYCFSDRQKVLGKVPLARCDGIDRVKGKKAKAEIYNVSKLHYPYHLYFCKCIYTYI